MRWKLKKLQIFDKLLLKIAIDIELRKPSER